VLYGSYGSTQYQFLAITLPTQLTRAKEFTLQLLNPASNLEQCALWVDYSYFFMQLYRQNNLKATYFKEKVERVIVF
jgi:hypothetical protein